MSVSSELSDSVNSLINQQLANPTMANFNASVLTEYREVDETNQSQSEDEVKS